MPKQKIKQYEVKHIPTYIHGTKTPDMSLPSKHNSEPGSRTKLFGFQPLHRFHRCSGWNLNSFVRLPGPALCFEGSDFSGVLVPLMFVGMRFSSYYFVFFVLFQF
jgi:hypothetical protein